MPDSIADAAVALTFMREALTLLDAPEHTIAAAHLRAAINELSPESLPKPSPSGKHGESG